MEEALYLLRRSVCGGGLTEEERKQLVVLLRQPTILYGVMKFHPEWEKLCLFLLNNKESA